VLTFEERIDPELLPGLEVYRLLGFTEQRLEGEVIQAIRAKLAEFRELAGSTLPPNDRVARTDHLAPGPEGAPDVPVRLYRPVDASGPLPCLVWIHGGGMILGTIDADDFTCDALSEAVGCAVVSVGYRLAPEHPHPAPVEDCFAALRWVAASAAELGLDPARIAVGGGSAGAGLAAATALLTRDRSGPGLVFQLLVYPMLDDRNVTPSSREFAGVMSWSREHNLSGWSALLGDGAGGEGVSEYAAPARATDLSGLPPALIQVGELDLFRDEDIEYAARLLQAGVATELEVYPGAYHGFDALNPESGAAQRAFATRVRALRRAFG